MDDMENKIRHLEMIQNIINRMSTNSFTLKGWAVTLLVGILALSNKDTEKMYFLIGYVPIVVFWWLDSFYLLQEKLYRSLYNQVRNMDVCNIDFNLTASAPGIKKIHKIKNYFSCVFSISELSFYLPLALVLTIVFFATNCNMTPVIFTLKAGLLR